MPLSHEHVGPKILAKIKTYFLTRAELLCSLCYEIPCIILSNVKTKWEKFCPSQNILSLVKLCWNLPYLHHFLGPTSYWFESVASGNIKLQGCYGFCSMTRRALGKFGSGDHWVNLHEGMQYSQRVWTSDQTNKQW